MYVAGGAESLNLKPAVAGGGAARDQVRDLQRNLRALGYLRSGIDGAFGTGTEFSVKALQHHISTNNGNGKDGRAPVRIKDYNKGRVSAVTGVVDFGLAPCISDMLDDPDFPTLPFADAPVAKKNQELISTLRAMPLPPAPIPFLLGILMQESGLKHFREPKGADQDSYIVVGLDTSGATRKHVISSRRYGAGQYMLFHHSPRTGEIPDFMVNANGNVSKALSVRRDKFDHLPNPKVIAPRLSR